MTLITKLQIFCSFFYYFFFLKISRLISQVCNTIQAITLSPLIKLDGFCLEWVHLTAEANGIKTITIINFCSVLCKKIGPCSISAVNLVNFTVKLNN